MLRLTEPAEENMSDREDPEVTAFLRDLDHPLKAEILAVRAILLGLDPSIGEMIKWKAPSFYAADDFATFNLRSTTSLQLILHTGVKVREGPGPKVEDPTGLLKWLAKDRALLTLGVGEEIKAKRPAFEALIRAWLPQL
jgi:hypothetical protein